MNELFSRESEVTAADRAELAIALRSAYPDFGFLYLRLANKMGVRADDYFNLGRGRIPIAADIVEYAWSQGKLLELLAVAWTDVPGNRDLKVLADQYLPDQQGVLVKFGATIVSTATTAAPASLEKLVEKRSRLIDIVAFNEGMTALAHAICRIGTPDIQGTGFLIGRHTVLTNFHVMKDVIRGDTDGAKIFCEFDYHGVGKPSVKLPVAEGLEWKGPNSPFSQSDLSGSGEPAPGELDFAVIKLADDVEPKRALLKWPIAPPIVAQRDFVVIGQHPGGHEAKIAFGEVVEYPASGLRYRYDVTTEPGSSGSPVLDMSLELVALHHAGDPSLDPKYNQGVPIWLIRQALVDSGFDLDSA